MVHAQINEPWIGIDLGTTNSCVGLWINGRVEILQNNEGLTTTPSCVAFKPNQEVSIGISAYNQAARFAANTIYDAKRLIGRSFSDPHVTEDRKFWPFKVVDGGRDRP